MLSIRNLAFVLSFAMMELGCHTINSVSLTQIPAKRSKPVDAEVSKFIFLGLTFDNDFVDPLVSKLRDQCNGGQVKGILTKDATVNYFLGIITKRQVTARGFCAGKDKEQKVSQLEPDR